MDEQAIINIERFFEKRSVEFGDIPRYNNIAQWPFWMPLVPEPPTDRDRFPSRLSQSLTGLGWPIGPGATRDIPLITEADAHYHIVNHKLTAYRGPLTGSISCLANDTAVTGVNTLFNTELQAGDRIVAVDASGQTRFAFVSAVADATNLTLEANFGPNAVAGASATALPAAYRLGEQWYESLPHLTGGIQVAGAAVTGIGTAFTTELEAATAPATGQGQTLVYVDDTGVVRAGLLNNITNNTTATFTTSPGNAAGLVNGVSYMLGCLPRMTFNHIRPLTTYLRTSLFIKSNSDIYLLGGSNELSGAGTYSPFGPAGGLQERPHIQRSLQGARDGLSSLYTPFQMPRNGVLTLRITNTHDLYTLYVNGAIFGYKVAA